MLIQILINIQYCVTMIKFKKMTEMQRDSIKKHNLGKKLKVQNVGVTLKIRLRSPKCN